MGKVLRVFLVFYLFFVVRVRYFIEDVEVVLQMLEEYFSWCLLG